MIGDVGCIIVRSIHPELLPLLSVIVFAVCRALTHSANDGNRTDMHPLTGIASSISVLTDSACISSIFILLMFICDRQD